jgi:hypothetical protein
MKKSELEEAYQELQYRYNKLHSDSRNEINKLEFFLKQERKNTITDLEDKMYETWKELNGKFMKRYIEDLIMHDELQFSFKSGYSGHFDMEIRMGDKFLTSVDGDICMKENSLEW